MIRNSGSLFRPPCILQSVLASPTHPIFALPCRSVSDRTRQRRTVLRRTRNSVDRGTVRIFRLSRLQRSLRNLLRCRNSRRRCRRHVYFRWRTKQITRQSDQIGAAV